MSDKNLLDLPIYHYILITIILFLINKVVPIAIGVDSNIQKKN